MIILIIIIIIIIIIIMPKVLEVIKKRKPSIVGIR